MIYLDNAATTKMYNECLEDLKKYSCDIYFNPSALYSQALEPSIMMRNVKSKISKILGCSCDELYFTASGSESNNISLLNTIKQKKGKVIISSVEHAAVSNTAIRLEEIGYDVVYAPVDNYGKVIISDFEKLLDNNVVLVSIMHVCNETGALNSIKELVEITKKFNKNIIFHSDGVQAFGKIPINLSNLGVDLYSISSHKIHGPKGVGLLYVKKNIHPRTFIYGGGQEGNIRSATENVPGIAAFGKAVDITYENLMIAYKKAREMQHYTIDFITHNFEDCIINTNINESSPYIISFSLKNIRGEGIVHYLENKDIIIGTGSACSSKKGLKRIPNALKISQDYQNGMLRISYDPFMSMEDLKLALNELHKAIEIERNLKK